MKRKVVVGARMAVDIAKARPKETTWSIIGALAGVIAGFLIGGVGVAAMGGAFGIPAALILAVLGGLIGNRYGISKDRPLSS